MRDGIAVARSGKPAVAFVTSKFWRQGEFVARAEGMPDIPRFELPHPIAGSGAAAMRSVADNIMAAVFARLEEG